MVIPTPNAAAAGIAIPISLLLAVTCAIAFAVGLFHNPKTPAGASVISKSIWPNMLVSMILVEP